MPMYLLCQVMMDQLHASLERQPSQGGLACDKKIAKTLLGGSVKRQRGQKFCTNEARLPT